MRNLAHIINPVIMPVTSDLSTAQPVTFETMRIAREFAGGDVDVELYTAQYPEDRPLVPSGFTSTPDLDRSVLDFGEFAGNKKLPLINDILTRLYNVTSAEYMIYTNVDIALMPGFYMAVNRLIDRGYDAFVINRRTIPDHYSGISEIPLMYGEAGWWHPGHDCFVFRRELFPACILRDTCIGALWIGRIMLCNLACHGSKFKEFKESHLTFHIGDDREWRGEVHSPYNVHNEMEVLNCLDEIVGLYGPFSENDPVSRYISGFVYNRQRELDSYGGFDQPTIIQKLRKILRRSKSKARRSIRKI